MPKIGPGRYRHYKGNEYTVLGVARHSETQEEFVVYRQEYGDRGLWIRPAAMFAETVTVDGVSVARFSHLGGKGSSHQKEEGSSHRVSAPQQEPENTLPPAGSRLL
jgi:hypothetical protein